MRRIISNWPYTVTGQKPHFLAATQIYMGISITTRPLLDQQILNLEKIHGKVLINLYSQIKFGIGLIMKVCFGDFQTIAVSRNSRVLEYVLHRMAVNWV